jgi:hypothetical protein
MYFFFFKLRYLEPVLINPLYAAHDLYFNHLNVNIKNCIFLIRVVRVGVQLDPLGTAATNWPIVLAPGDYEDGEFGGMVIGRGNRSNRRKPAPVPLCPPQIPHDLTGSEPGPPRWEASD